MLEETLSPGKPKTTWVTYYQTAWFMAGFGLFAQLIFPYVGYRALGSVYLLAILTVSLLSTRGPILFSAITSALSWNYFFLPPRFTFSVSSQEDVMMLLVFFVTATVSGLLTTKIRNQEENLQKRQERMSHLYELVKVLAGADSIDEIKTIFKSTVENQFDAEIEIRIKGKYQAQGNTQITSATSPLCFPMKGKTEIIGDILFFQNEQLKLLNTEEQHYLETVISQVAIAIERSIFSESVMETKFLQESQKLHQTLLNSVSHELRTPITAIIGTATALQDENIIKQSEARLALTSELINSSMRLERVVENLLDVSRLEKDTLKIKKEWFEVSDLIEEAKSHLKSEVDDRTIKVSGDVSTIIEGDFKLLEHALRNLIFNAIKYTPKGSSIEIRVSMQKEFTKILVVDEGKGFPRNQSELLFEKFYRVPGTPAGGLGLGLSIVKNIIELHGGKITAFNRLDVENKPGAIFEINLLNKTQPEILKGVVIASKS